MEHKIYSQINEVVYTHTIDNGLKVQIVPKSNFFKTFVYLGVNFGSLTNRFIPIGKQEMIEVPLGIAHFLEHKLFANADGTDASNLLAELGLEANAYTDYNQTVYLFNGAKNIEQGIKILLDFVQNPYFTEKNVASEKNIIIQELKMYLDIPSDRLHNGLMKNLFETYPIRYDIGGTIKEVRKITKENLEICYQTFYHPANMKLIIVGNVDSQAMIQTIVEHQKQKTYPLFSPIKKELGLENQVAYQKNGSYHMDVATASVAVGIKVSGQQFNRNQAIIEEILLKIALAAAIGPSTPYYQKLLDQELIANHLHYAVYFDGYCGYIKVYADSHNPKALRRSLVRRLQSLHNLILSDKIFERFKKAVLGSFIKSLNNLDFLASLIIEYDVKNCDILESISLLEKLKITDLDSVLKYFQKEAISSYLILPNEKKEVKN